MRSFLIDVFQDTQKQIYTNPLLQEAVRNTIQKQYVVKAESERKPAAVRYASPAPVIVSPKRSFEAAMGYSGKKVCVLNFASATHVGGGVVRGAGAQEECLCRCSTLYNALNDAPVRQAFHESHYAALIKGEMNSWYNDDCVYSPDIVIFKSDDGKYTQLDPKDYVSVNVITCAAPNLNNRYPLSDVTPEKIAEVHRSRAQRILQLAQEEGAEVVVLGAFGCGAFRNPPEIAAKAWADVVAQYRQSFETIEFAVVSKSGEPSWNYTVFSRVMGQAFGT